MKYRDEDEVIIDIWKEESIKKEYSIKFWLLVVALFSLGFMAMYFSEDEAGINSILDYVGVTTVLGSIVLAFIGFMKPSILKIADIEYHKTSITTEWDYKDFIATGGNCDCCYCSLKNWIRIRINQK